MGMRMLKVAIVGCGKIADDHVAYLEHMKGCEIVGVCDTEPLMARQFYERFPVKRCFTDLRELLGEAKPDVVHITTPPESHFDIASLCLEAGCHIYVEKPFTLHAEEAERLVALAKQKDLKITAGHNGQFTHAARSMRALVQSGFLGDRPVHMESYFCYGLGSSAYAAAFLTDRRHWIRRLPGKLLQNTISHGIASIAEFLTTESPHIIAHGFVSPFLRSMDETEIIDELRVIIHETTGVTAYFTFSSQMRPSLHQFRIYGARNGLLLDHDHEILLKLRGKAYKSYLEKFIPPLQFTGQYLGNLRRNLSAFLRNDFHVKSGLKYLIESFYRSITDGDPVPIPYREIILTARIMDGIFGQLGEERPQSAPPTNLQAQAAPLSGV